MEGMKKYPLKKSNKREKSDRDLEKRAASLQLRSMGTTVALFTAQCRQKQGNIKIYSLDGEEEGPSLGKGHREKNENVAGGSRLRCAACPERKP